MADKKLPMQIRQIEIKNIVVNHKYQRALNERNPVLRNDFDEDLFEPLRVSVVSGGKFEAQDGQHKLERLTREGYTHAPCIVLDGASRNIEIRAQHFVDLNTGRQNPKALDRFRAELVAKNPRAVTINRVALSLGIKIGSDVTAISPLQALYRDGGETLLKDTLSFILDTWGKDTNRALCGAIIAGAGLILDDPRKFNRKRLSAKLAVVAPSAILMESNSYATTGSSSGGARVARVIERLYNKGARNKI